MLRQDDIIYAAQTQPQREITHVEPGHDFKVLLTFSGGEKRIYDTTPLHEYGLFQNLKDPEFFSQVRVSRGTIEWPGELNLCPNSLYMESEPVEV